mgnify:CR=1 FL=1
MQGNKEDYSFKLIDADCGDLLPTKKNELSDKFLKFLTKETHEYTYKELSAEFKCNFEHARRICIKLFTEGKIEQKIVDGWIAHFREFGNGVIGLEDLYGGGDNDFDDLIFGFDLKLTV